MGDENIIETEREEVADETTPETDEEATEQRTDDGGNAGKRGHEHRLVIMLGDVLHTPHQTVVEVRMQIFVSCKQISK